MRPQQDPQVKEIFKNVKVRDRIRYQKFCLHFYKEFNASKAWIMCGGSPRSAGTIGPKLLQQECVQKYLRYLYETERKNLFSGDEPLTMEWVLEQLRVVYRRCMDTLHLDAAGANRSLELLGRYLGMWIERIEHTYKIEDVRKFMFLIINIVKAEVTDADVRDRIATRFENIGIIDVQDMGKTSEDAPGTKNAG